MQISLREFARLIERAAHERPLVWKNFTGRARAARKFWTFCGPGAPKLGHMPVWQVHWILENSSVTDEGKVLGKELKQYRKVWSLWNDSGRCLQFFSTKNALSLMCLYCFSRLHSVFAISYWGSAVFDMWFRQIGLTDVTGGSRRALSLMLKVYSVNNFENLKWRNSVYCSITS